LVEHGGCGVQTGDVGTSLGQQAGKRARPGAEIENRLARCTDAERLQALDEMRWKACAVSAVVLRGLAEIDGAQGTAWWASATCAAIPRAA